LHDTIVGDSYNFSWHNSIHYYKENESKIKSKRTKLNEALPY
jgi:hypothetical protein